MRTGPDPAPAAVLRFADLSRADEGVAGSKGANLGELLRAGFNVPPGFVVTTDAFRRSMDAAGIRERLIDQANAAVPADDDALDQLSTRLRQLVRVAGISRALSMQIVDAYDRLCFEAGGEGDCVAVAVRSSGIGEDSAVTSRAGVNASFTDVVGGPDLLRRVIDCWTSLYGPRAIAYRAGIGQTAEPAMAVVVQAMVRSERSAVAFSVDPTTADPARLVIDAAFGLGEVVVGGLVEPDTYVVDRRGRSIIERRIGHQAFKIVGDGTGPDHRVDLHDRVGGRQVLTDDEVLAIAATVERIEEHFGTPQDVEVAIDGHGAVFVVQTRPITGLATAGSPEAPSRPIPSIDTSRLALVHGVGGAPGVASGAVRVLRTPGQGHLLEAGEVLVAPTTSPEWLPAMRRAAAIVTEGGGPTCHAAIVGRELGVPTVVGAPHATEVLTRGLVVDVDGTTGTISSARDRRDQPDGRRFEPFPTAAPQARAAPEAVAPATSEAPDAPPDPATAGPLGTLLQVNVARPEDAAATGLAVGGVGLLRAEVAITRALDHTHPRQLIADGGSASFVDHLATSLVEIARPFAPRPVFYRMTDLRSDELRHLRAGADYEAPEANPMIGFRGCLRSTREPAVLTLELAALARAREELPNLQLMIPFVRTPAELERGLELIERSPLGRQRGLERWIIAEVPSVIFRLTDYAALGIDGVAIGMSDLTQLMLGIDRTSARCQDVYDETDAAVLGAVDTILDTAHTCGLATSLIHRGPIDPVLVEHVIRRGITCLSVDPDELEHTADAIAVAERQLLLSLARDAD